MTPQLRRAMPRSIQWVAAGAAALSLVTAAGQAGATKTPKHKPRGTPTTRVKAHHQKAKKAPPLGHAVTLSFFLKPTKKTLTSATGKKLHPGTPAGQGDTLHLFDKAYSGSHARHGKRVAATDSLTCTYTSATTAKCNYQITVKGSKVTAHQVAATFSAGVMTMPVNGGTGKYQRAKGLITETGIAGSRNADLSVVVLPSAS